MTDPATHHFEIALHWPADPAQAKPPETAFSRNNRMQAAGKHPVEGSAPAVFGGSEDRYNPEDLLLMSLSECHMLTFLAMAARRRIAVLAYEDRATGTLAVPPPGGPGHAGRMSMQEVVLRPTVTVARGTDLAAALALHDRAHANCFMANSVNFPVRHEPVFVEA